MQGKGSEDTTGSRKALAIICGATAICYSSVANNIVGGDGCGGVKDGAGHVAAIFNSTVITLTVSYALHSGKIGKSWGKVCRACENGNVELKIIDDATSEAKGEPSQKLAKAYPCPEDNVSGLGSYRLRLGERSSVS